MHTNDVCAYDNRAKFSYFLAFKISQVYVYIEIGCGHGVITQCASCCRSKFIILVLMLVCVCGLLNALLEGGPFPTSVPPTVTSLPLINKEKSCPICTSTCSGSLPVIGAHGYSIQGG